MYTTSIQANVFIYTVYMDKEILITENKYMYLYAHILYMCVSVYRAATDCVEL